MTGLKIMLWMKHPGRWSVEWIRMKLVSIGTKKRRLARIKIARSVQKGLLGAFGCARKLAATAGVRTNLSALHRVSKVGEKCNGINGTLKKFSPFN